MNSQQQTTWKGKRILVSEIIKFLPCYFGQLLNIKISVKNEKWICIQDAFQKFKENLQINPSSKTYDWKLFQLFFCNMNKKFPLEIEIFPFASIRIGNIIIILKIYCIFLKNKSICLDFSFILCSLYFHKIILQWNRI